MLAREPLRQAVGFGVDDEIDLTLPVQGNVLRSMPRHAAESHGFEQLTELGGIRRRVFDELESVGCQRVCRFAQGFGCLHNRAQMRRFGTVSLRPRLHRKKRII